MRGFFSADMKDLQTRAEQLFKEAAECDLIANLATDPQKRETFERLARQYRAMLDELKSDIARRTDVGEKEPG